MDKLVTKAEFLHSASYAIMKGMDSETLYYSDEMYGREEQTDEVWEYVVESQEIGLVAFREKYKEFDLYPI
jgi:hypothetical protein